MKKLLWGAYFLGFLFISSQFLSFTKRTASAEAALEAATQEFHQGLEHLSTLVTDYQKHAERLSENPKTVQDLRTVHLTTRWAFKKIEFLLEYNDRESVKKFLNGPPLPSLYTAVPWIEIIEPTGLQMLDELVLAENPLESKDEILKHTAQLKENYSKIYTYQKNVRLQHRFIFEATRFELIRIFTLGVTGFDTPGGSEQAIEEAYTALNGTYRALQGYFPLLQNKALDSELRQTYNNALTFLKNNKDFESFDRLTFLKKYINPLYKLVLEAQLALNIETEDDVNNLPTALNYKTTNIFADNLLNISYFSKINPNHFTQKRIELGRTLFFDPILSSNNERACASCHHPDKAFTDGLPKSLAINGQGTIQRNAPTLINAVFSERFFYDMREPKLERQIKHVVMDHNEFNTDFLTIIEKLQQSDEYRQLFAAAYAEQGQYQLSKWSVSDALACYVASLTSFNSPFDQYVRDETQKIDPAVARGFNLFMGKAACGTCHFAPTFNGTVPPYFQETESEVLGVPISKDTIHPQLDSDLGRYASARPHDEAPFYVHSFKTVTVRNAAITAPYMHNGVYDTLEEVVDFYNKGGGQGLGLVLEYQTLPFDNLSLNQNEIKDLVKFMEALSDTTGLTRKPEKLPVFENKPEWNKRQIGGIY
ncbi:MAG: cytochrome c peroxidase [Saprospiraceae bacterium]|nr:cytochrome c peroxidase [Saprospiraceae bacterium]